MKSMIQSSISYFLLLIAVFSGITMQAQSGWVPQFYSKIPAGDKHDVFFDEFENNENRWNLTSSLVEMKINDGEFWCRSRTDKVMTRRRFVTVNYSGDYEIELNIRYVNGPSSEPVGLTFGKDAAENGYTFFFNAEGKYKIAKKEGGRETKYVDWTRNALLGKYSYNTLTVRKVDSKWYFFINRERVFQCDAGVLFGYDMGFTLGSYVTMEVDYFRVVELESSDAEGPTILLAEPGQTRNGVVQTISPITRVSGSAIDGSGIREIVMKYNNERIQIPVDKYNRFATEIRLKESTPSTGMRVVIEAEDNFGNRKSKVFYLVYKAAPKPIANTARHAGKNYLLTIGINNYLHWSPLHNATKDCDDIAQVLFQHYTFEPENAIHLTNREATRENIIEALQSLEARITSKDNLLIYYAGHGYYDHNSKRGYWVPVNARQNKIADYIRNSTIHDYLSSIESHNTLLIADACYAGSLFSRNRGTLNEASPSRWAFTSGDIEKVWDGQPGDNSPFAKYLIYYLKQNSKRRLKADELITTVKTAVVRNTSQTPIGDPLQNVGDQGGVFIFYRK